MFDFFKIKKLPQRKLKQKLWKETKVKISEGNQNKNFRKKTKKFRKKPKYNFLDGKQKF